MAKTTLKNVLDTIHKWSKDNDVEFFGSFVSFKKDGEVKDGRLICYGNKETIEIAADEFSDLLEKEKSEFVNW